MAVDSPGSGDHVIKCRKSIHKGLLGTGLSDVSDRQQRSSVQFSMDVQFSRLRKLRNVEPCEREVLHRVRGAPSRPLPGRQRSGANAVNAGVRARPADCRVASRLAANLFLAPPGPRRPEHDICVRRMVCLRAAQPDYAVDATRRNRKPAGCRSSRADTGASHSDANSPAFCTGVRENRGRRAESQASGRAAAAAARCGDAGACPRAKAGRGGRPAIRPERPEAGGGARTRPGCPTDYPASAHRLVRSTRAP